MSLHRLGMISSKSAAAALKWLKSVIFAHRVEFPEMSVKLIAGS